MDSISSVNLGIYSSLIEGIGANTGGNVPKSITPPPTQTSSTDVGAPVDLRNYYANIQNKELATELGENVKQAANDLSNTISKALENGYTINDAVNIQKAKCAYQANCEVMKSTFELAI